MNRTQRLIIYLVVALLIPTLIWLIYHEIPRDAWLWIAFVTVVLVGYEIGLLIQKKIRKRK